MRRLAWIAVLAAVIGLSGAPAHHTIGTTPPAKPWTPPFWHPQPTAAITGRSVCFYPDFAPVRHAVCYHIDGNSYPYGKGFAPTIT